MSDFRIAFMGLLEDAGHEDYERCAFTAKELADLYGEDPEAAPYLRFAAYFRFFAEGYRIWQISYRYVAVRNRFRAAERVMTAQDSKGGAPEQSPEAGTLAAALALLTDALCEYTRCENAIIANDPFALRDHARTAVEHEERALSLLDGSSSTDPILAGIGDWLTGYLQMNCDLHRGFYAVADVYSRVIQDRDCSTSLWMARLQEAKEALTRLQTEHDSVELASELNAHIRHIETHRRRIENPDTTTLRIQRGKLVLSLSASCNMTLVDAVLDDPDQFLSHIQQGFAELGVQAQNIRETQLHDIFATSFGTRYLRGLAFDLPSFEVCFLSGRVFWFVPRITISAFGVCTVSFQHEIGGEADGLDVEFSRALQTLICPHAPQVDIRFPSTASGLAFTDRQPAGSTPILAFRFGERLDIREASRCLERLCDQLPAGMTEDDRASVVQPSRRAQILLEDTDLVGRLDFAGSEAADPFESIRESIAEAVRNGSRIVRSGRLGASDAGKLQMLIDQVTAVCNKLTYVSDVAELYLNVMARGFQSVVRESVDISGCFMSTLQGSGFNRDRVWLLRKDTGWFSYIYAIRIDEIARDGSVLREHVGFDEIAQHPDTSGFIIDQREARASFDDWRFIAHGSHETENLAFVRSHSTDGFFLSEYQSFMYLPDDPLYLTDQYEATVELAGWIDTVIKYYDALGQCLNASLRTRLAEVILARRTRTRIGAGDLKVDLGAMKALRADAMTLQALISKVGISRYKDHGDLMIRIIENMKLDRAVEVLDVHLGQLQELQAHLVEVLRERKERGYRFGVLVLSSLLGATAVEGLISSLFASFAWEAPQVQGIVSVVVLVAVVAVLITLGRITDD